MRCAAILLAVLPVAAMAATVDLELPICQPCERSPAIDGRLDDWQGVEERTVQQGEGRTVALRTAYDAQAFYLAAAWTAPRPPANTGGPAAWPAGGDGLCLHLTVDGAVVHVLALPSADGAAGSLAVRRDGEAWRDLLAEGGAAAVANAAGGWTQELRIPWKAMTASGAPPLGRPLPAVIDCAWSSEDPLTICTSLGFGRRSPLRFAYTMPRDAEVTLGVYTADGQLVRYLTRSAFRRAGPNVEWWDGRDQDRKFLPAGEYRLKALYHDALGLEHQLSVGNPGNPAWSTADGGGDWLGDESNPQAAATDGEWVYLASPCSEKGFRIVAVDGNGQRRWGGGGGPENPRCVSLAVAGDHLYLLACGPEKTDNQHRFTGKNADNRVLLGCYDKRTGAAARFSLKQPMVKVASWPYQEKLVGLWELFNARSFSPDAYGGLPRYGDCQYGEVAEAMGLAATADTLWIAYHTQGVLRAYDAATGAARPERDIPLDRPVGLLARPDGSLLAVSGTRVVRIDPATKQATPVVSVGLVAPFGVAADKAGNLYVSDWRDSFQVKVFSPDGTPLRAIGKPGGRAPLGAWDPSGMILPRGIAVTDAGKLWVAEDDTTPRRVSVWDAASGRLVRDYLGPTPYGGGSPFWFEPGDRSVLHTMGCSFKLDWAAKTWTPLASELRRMDQAQPFTLCGAAGMCHAVRTLRREGRDYAVVPFSYDTIAIYQRQDLVWRAVAAVGCLHRWATDDGTGVSVWDSDVGAHLVKGFRPEVFRGHSGENFAWSDRNDDGLLQADEVTFSKTSFRGDAWSPGRQPEFVTGWGHGCDGSFTLALGGETKVEGASGTVICRLAPTGFSPGGAPLYDIRTTTDFATGRGLNGLYADVRGRVYAAGAEDTGADALTCFDGDGRRLWRIAGRTRPGRHDPVASSVTGELTVPGIGPAVGTWAWHGNYRPYLIADDGLYIGTVQGDDKAGPAGLWDESWRFWYQDPQGGIFLVNGANQGHHILRVTGLEQAGRFEGRLTISRAEAEAAAAAAADDEAPAPAPRTPPIAVRWADAPPVIDGDLADWRPGYGVTIPLGQGRKAQAALARDAATLYLAWRVEDDSPLVNQGSNWQTLFTTGDCVDLMLGSDPGAPAGRNAAAPGDLRLLCSVFQGRPVAVLYRPLVPGTAKPVQLMAARLDRIELLEQAQVAVRRGDGIYAVEAAVPLAALGLDAGALDVLRGDLGVVSSDAAGRDRVKRSYHFNQRTQITADLSTEATLQPAEWGEVRFPLGRNLLRDGGFEAPLAARIEDGWCAGEIGPNTRITTAANAAHSGRRGALFRQLVPVPYPPESFLAPDYRDFLKAGNGGRGGSGGVLAQKVPVQGGRRYSLRFFYRTEGTKGDEVKVPSAKRGYTSFHCAINWLGADGRWTGVQSVYEDRDWTPVMNGGTHMLPTPYLAPPRVDAAIILFRAAINAPGLTPAMMLDDVEFCEAP